MTKFCFTLKVLPDKLDEYRARHAAVWPEMQDALRACGWLDYTLFLRPDGLAVGCLETDDFKSSLGRMQAVPVNERWQREMAPLADTAGRPPDQALWLLDPIFRLD